MKTSMKKALALVLAVCAVFACVIIPNQAVKSSAAAASYSETTFGEGKFLITTTDSNGINYYLPTDAATNSGPKKVSFTDVNSIDDKHLWTVTPDGNGNYYIQNSDGQYLYTTTANGGVRVSTPNPIGAWVYDSSENSLKYESTGRYLGVYTTGSDWRSYNTVGQANYSGTSVNFKFYKVNEVDDSLATSLNAVNSYMSLGYKYTSSTKENTEATPAESTDTLNLSFTGVNKGTSYGDWSGKTGDSGAVYAGNNAGSDGTIQLRTNNNNSGIVVTNSAGKVKSITIAWNSATNTARKVAVYGKNTAYTAATDLYDTNKQGTKLGELAYGTTTFTIDGDYEFIGIRSTSSALYLDSITIEWEPKAETTVTSYNNSQFAIRCGVDATLADIEGVTEYGIKVSDEFGNYKFYNSDSAYWNEDELNGKFYVTINLGDIINDLNKLGAEFTVEAYVKVDGNTFTSTSSKKFSVAGMVQTYYTEGNDDVKSQVQHFYDYLDKEGLI